MTKLCEAYAYIDDEGVIDPATVASSRLGVAVNVIVVGSYRNMIPTSQNTQAEIDLMFLNVTGGIGSIEKVIITKSEN